MGTILPLKIPIAIVGTSQIKLGSPCCQDQQLRSLSVPESIHEEWKKGGTSRARLQELFASCGFDKDATWFSSLFCHDFRSLTQKKKRLP